MDEGPDPAALTVEATRALAVAGHADLVWGHVSVRDPEARGVWMKASGWSFEEVTRDRVVLVSSEGVVLEGTGRRHVEFPIHTQIMAARPEVNAVVHSHAPSAVAFASLEIPLRAVSHDAVSFLDPDVPRFTETGDLVSDRHLGDALADCLGGSAGALMPHHGLVTVGETVGIAVMRAVLLNRACAVQLQTLQAGGPATWSDEDEVAAKRETAGAPAQMEAGYRYLVRRAERGLFPTNGV